MKLHHIVSMLASLLCITLLTMPCLAESKYSIPVSCTIPSIPGVNAPLPDDFQDEGARNGQTTRQITSEAETVEQEETRFNNGEVVIVKSIYGR